MRPARERRAQCNFSSRRTIFRRSRSCLETQVQRVFQPFPELLRRNVFLSSPGHTHGIVMGQDRAVDELSDCLPRRATVVGDAETLAHGGVWPRCRRNYRQRRRAQGLLNLQSTRDRRAGDRRIMNDLAEITAFAKRYAEAWCSQDPEKVAAF